MQQAAAHEPRLRDALDELGRATGLTALTREQFEKIQPLQLACFTARLDYPVEECLARFVNDQMRVVILSSRARLSAFYGQLSTNVQVRVLQPANGLPGQIINLPHLVISLYLF
jgi:hypothetical protein